ncbi:recombinase family protein [Chamaesiphon sp. VAR_48_metabat_403]|uniref:recombinase family protein n=1 Tax=Chamaesiphon sp. VAR_48_metabat_403 TaxID=2964700 RepID=UPI00286E8502|nr:recombinase family protein [Chamaesiphon sp. VAR_48_metabat_403]
MENLEGKNGRLRCAIYVRVSTKDQNCDRQETELVSYAARCGYDVVGIFREIASGARIDRQERKKIIQLARNRSIDLILVSELTRWGRSTIDLIGTLHQLQSWGVSLVAQNGFQFDLSTPHGKMIASIMATLAEFERDLIRERISSGIANARAKGKVFGRPRGGKVAKSCDRVRAMSKSGKSYAQIGLEVGISKSSVGKCFECDRVK